MVCCTLSVAMIATSATLWKRLMMAVGRGGAVRLACVAGDPSGVARPPSMIAAVVASYVALALVLPHLDHYAARAHANDRTVLAEILAQPICSGARPTLP